jgi:hypothetical protein
MRKGDRFLSDAVPILLRTVAPAPSAVSMAGTALTTFLDDSVT